MRWKVESSMAGVLEEAFCTVERVMISYILTSDYCT